MSMKIDLSLMAIGCAVIQLRVNIHLLSIFDNFKKIGDSKFSRPVCFPQAIPPAVIWKPPTLVLGPGRWQREG